jgi:hypothetical protein
LEERVRKLLQVTTVLVVGAALVGASSAGAAEGAAKKAATAGFYRGNVIHYFDFGPIKLKAGNKLAPIWAVTNGPSGQRNIVDTVPGRADYSPLWQVSMVTWKGSATPRLLRSAADVKAAQQAGLVTVAKTATVVNCPVLGFGQKRVTGFSNGHVIHYYDDGPVKVKAGNETAPLYAPMNGVAGQHNIALENVAPGQTDYPPLWAIIAVQWKAGAKKSLLRSAADVRRAKAKGLLTTKQTALVVNCPVVA